MVFTHASSVLTEDELLEHKRKLTSDPKFRPGLVELSDARSVTDLAISASGIESFVAQDHSDSERLKGFRLAIVVSGAFEFGMGSMYELMSHANKMDVRIFRDMRLAKEWLQIKD